MRTYKKATECFAVLCDPAQPDRPPAFQVTVVTMIDLEDGSPPFMDPRPENAIQILNMSQAKASGIDLHEFAMLFESEALLSNERLQEALTAVAAEKAKIEQVMGQEIWAQKQEIESLKRNS